MPALKRVVPSQGPRGAAPGPPGWTILCLDPDSRPRPITKLDYQPVAYAIKGAKVVVAPRTHDRCWHELSCGKGIIEGPSGPPTRWQSRTTAELIDRQRGWSPTSGFVDMYTTLGQARWRDTRSQVGAGRTVKIQRLCLPPHSARQFGLGITPEFEVASVSRTSPDATADERRPARIHRPGSLPPAGRGIATGQSALFEPEWPSSTRGRSSKRQLALHIHVARARVNQHRHPDPNEAPARFHEAISAATGATRALSERLDGGRSPTFAR